MYVWLFFWRKNSILYILIRVCTIINFWCWPSYTMLIWACTIIRIQPFDQQFFCPLKSHCFQTKKLKIKLMKSQKNEASFADSRWFCSFPYSNPCILLLPSWAFFFVFTICCVPFLTFPHYTIILSYTVIDFLRFFHPILLFYPMLLLIF